MQASDSLVFPPIGTLAFHTDPAWQVNASSHNADRYAAIFNIHLPLHTAPDLVLAV